jgi:hypothetical protein
MVKQISDSEIYLLIKYIKSVLWRVAKRLFYIEDARCLNVKTCQRLCANIAGQSSVRATVATLTYNTRDI